MTREEAIAAFDSISNPGSFGTNAWIDRFVALGMLKLDAAPDGLEKLKSSMRRMGYADSSTAMRDLEEALNLAGLQVVESPQ